MSIVFDKRVRGSIANTAGCDKTQSGGQLQTQPAADGRGRGKGIGCIYGGGLRDCVRVRTQDGGGRAGQTGGGAVDRVHAPTGCA